MHLKFFTMLLAPVLLAASTSNAERARATEIVAHRGASHDAPENTMSAFRLGWEQQADANELDIYLSRDGQAVVMHDASTKRTAGVDKPIVEQTLAELQVLDAGLWKAPRWAGEKIPTLAQALAIVPAGKRMFVEIKCGPEILPELERVLKAAPVQPAQIVLIGFGYETMQQAKAKMPQYEACWLASYKKAVADGYDSPKVLIEKAKAADLDGLDLDYKFPIDAAFAAKVKAAGLKLYAWTVDDAAVARSLVTAGVDGITTNRPGWMREQLAAK